MYIIKTCRFYQNLNFGHLKNVDYQISEHFSTLEYLMRSFYYIFKPLIVKSKILLIPKRKNAVTIIILKARYI